MKNLGKISLFAVILICFSLVAQSQYFSNLTKKTFEGEAVSTKSKIKYPVIMKFTTYDTKTFKFEGTLEWTGLNSINKIEGQIFGSRMIFKETEYIKKGRAVLNCEYAIIIDKNTLDGYWLSFTPYDRGTITFHEK